MAIGTGWAEGSWIDASWIVGAWANLASITVTGTAVSGGVTESEIRAGGETIILTVTGDTFVVLNDTIRQAIIDGMTAATSPVNGWNNEVRDKEVVGSVVRDSATQITITLTAAPAYSIGADETVTITVPASALTGAVEAVADPVVIIGDQADRLLPPWLKKRRIIRGTL